MAFTARRSMGFAFLSLGVIAAAAYGSARGGRNKAFAESGD